MLTVDKEGLIQNPRVKLQIIAGLARGKMGVVHGLVVHQTGGSTAAAAFAGYKARPYGTHFLIDKDGAIYQNASLSHYTAHIGKIKARCLAENTCTPLEMKRYSGFNPSVQNRYEMKKEPGQRYPWNGDSIGIELVGEAPGDKFVSATTQQNASLRWLVFELSQTFRVPMTEVFRHPTVSWKQPTEASTAKW
jgi:N-acetyl-anhydromuramyl-L-alanine amidase AmpD